MHKPGLSIVIPVYNSEKTLRLLVEQLEKTLVGFEPFEILLINDSSTDSSYKIIKQLSDDYKEVTGISLDANYGQQSAILCGLRHAALDYAVIMDDDLEHNPMDIPKLFYEIKNGYDVVYALNSQKTYSGMFRAVGSKLRDITFNILTDKPKESKVCSFRILNRETVDNVIKADKVFVYISMEILKHTNNISNIYVDYGSRRESGHSMGKLVKLLFSIYVYYSKSRLLRGFVKSGPAYRIGETTGKAAK